MGNLFKLAAAVVALVTTSACTVKQADLGPAPFGPSGLALSLGLTALPDSISQDGASQSSIIVTAIDASGSPKAGVVVRLDMSVNGSVQDFGQLAARTVVTGTDGRASTIYTAPPSSPLAGGSGTFVSIVATPISSNFQTALSWTADIRLVPPGVILPPAETPTPAFQFSPATVGLDETVTFDATASCGGSLFNGSCQSSSRITSYVWNFGDGSTGSGSIVTHRFENIASYTVTLTVTNDRGLAASTSKTVTVAQSAAPTASFTSSPTNKSVNQNVFFNATASTAAAGRTIVSYEWNFGDGSAIATGANVTKQYTAANTYTVTLRVTDDLGRVGTTSQTVVIN